ncbi:MAG TPA: acyl-ACP--UDP-N-acetylglucosamine O-acyltransferase [Fibrobacteria bacterium]|nr:acyl-ACP--UDP-N-acetylglucosamine O-acyltransferase [Fibrobacteria bacterium]
MRIHPTAVLHPSLELPPDLEAGPYAVLDEDVELAPGVRIGPFCHVYPGTRLETGVRLEDGVIVGNAPQDMKYRGERTGVRIGAGTHLREYVTVNRGTAASGWTVLGRHCLIMAYAHVAHDCHIEDQAVIANNVHMGGHVRIGKAAVVSGMTGIHQYVVIGAGAFIGGGLRVDKDVLPFSKALGDPLRYAGLNEMGLARSGLPAGAGPELKAFYRGLFRDGRQAALAGPEGPGNGALGLILKGFFEVQKRGLLMRPLTGAR